MSKVQAFIQVTFQKAGFHAYPKAPEDVGYLANRHRHLFKFKIKIEVGGLNREIEFHQCLNWLESLYSEGHIELHNKSCEMLGEELLHKIKVKYGEEREIEIEVSEDGECSGIIHYLP